jgi:hypothetical protein
MQDVVHLDDIIENMTNTHVLSDNNEGAEAGTASNLDTILAHMAGRTSTGTSPGDIRKVLATKHGPSSKNKTFKMNETLTAPETLTMDDTTYYLNKGETISFQGCQYSAHSTMVAI